MRIGADYFASCAAFLSILLAFGCSKQSPNASLGRTEPGGSSFRASGGTNGVLERGPGGEGRSAEQGYTVSGQAFYKTLVVDRQFSFDFRLSVKKDRWGMEFTAIPFDGVRHIQNCDGSNLVAITYLKKAKDARAWNDGYVIVDNRNTPMGEPFVAHVVGCVGQFVGNRRRISCFRRLVGAPIRRGEASPLRVATGGNANWSSRVRCRRSPAPANETARVWYFGLSDLPREKKS
jgi:hypothetical protein